MYGFLKRPSHPTPFLSARVQDVCQIFSNTPMAIKGEEMPTCPLIHFSSPVMNLLHVSSLGSVTTPRTTNSQMVNLRSCPLSSEATVCKFVRSVSTWNIRTSEQEARSLHAVSSSPDSYVRPSNTVEIQYSAMADLNADVRASQIHRRALVWLEARLACCRASSASSINKLGRTVSSTHWCTEKSQIFCNVAPAAAN